MNKNEIMWMIRCGEGGYLFEEFKSKSMIGIGWNELGDLNVFEDKESIREKYTVIYDNDSPGKIVSSVTQIKKFKFDFNINQSVITYNPIERIYLIGTIVGGYEYKENEISDSYHIRRVNWEKEIKRDDLSIQSKNSLGSTLTIFEIPDFVKKELLDFKESGIEKIESEIETEKEVLEQIKDDTLIKSREFIKDKINKLDWEQMQELMAGVLRSMGYKTKISMAGSDRGRDIIASPDGLGLQNPRIIAEVKHRKGQMGTPNIRSFIGGLREGDKGIYLSTGGFSKEAKYEAERANIPITLIDLEYLGLTEKIKF
jgi:restriction system protein